MKSPSHPIWSLLRLLSLESFLALILYLNASHFDATEIKTLIYMLLGGSAAETLPFLIAKRETPPPPPK